MKNKRRKLLTKLTGISKDRHKEKYKKHKYYNDPIKRLLCQNCKSTIIHPEISVTHCRFHYYGQLY